jgi:hypothetical protein
VLQKKAAHYKIQSGSSINFSALGKIPAKKKKEASLF